MATMRYAYVVSGWFESDRPLTDDEVDALTGALDAQIQDPHDMAGERVEWTRFDYDVSVKPVGTRTVES